MSLPDARPARRDPPVRRGSRRPAPPAPPATGILGSLRTTALVTAAVLITAAVLVSFAESYQGLYQWAREHGLSGVWASAWPLQVDVFVAVGELTLFVALADQWTARARILPWTLTIAGLAVSVAGNVGHAAGHSAASHATAAVPPLAASAAMAAGLSLLKRAARARRPSPGSPRPAARPRAARPAGGPAPRPETLTSADVAAHFKAEIAAGKFPSQRAIRRQWGVGAERAKALHDELAG